MDAEGAAGCRQAPRRNPPTSRREAAHPFRVFATTHCAGGVRGSPRASPPGDRGSGQGAVGNRFPARAAVGARGSRRRGTCCAPSATFSALPMPLRGAHAPVEPRCRELGRALQLPHVAFLLVERRPVKFVSSSSGESPASPLLSTAEANPRGSYPLPSKEAGSAPAGAAPTSAEAKGFTRASPVLAPGGARSVFLRGKLQRAGPFHSGGEPAGELPIAFEGGRLRACRRCADLCGGEGIRTPGRLPYGGFQNRCLRPLGHASACRPSKKAGADEGDKASSRTFGTSGQVGKGATPRRRRGEEGRGLPAEKGAPSSSPARTTARELAGRGPSRRRPERFEPARTRGFRPAAPPARGAPPWGISEDWFRLAGCRG